MTCSSAQSDSRRPIRLPSAISAALAGTLAAIALAFSPAIGEAQRYRRVESVQIDAKKANAMQQSEIARAFVLVRGTQMTAKEGFDIIVDRAGNSLIVPGGVNRLPPSVRFESIIAWESNGQTAAFACMCAEENTNPNDDDCGFKVDGNQLSGCEWEGEGEARCTCVERIVVWGNGPELIMTYAGDPVGE